MTLDLQRGLASDYVFTGKDAEKQRNAEETRPMNVNEINVPVIYDGVEIELAYRLDLVVDNAVIVELKTVSKLLRIHEAQLLSYLKLSQHRVGLLINFRQVRLKHGIKRLVHRL